MSPATQPTKTLGILGTGRFARAFSSRSAAAGYSVTLGSRTPDDDTKTQPEVRVTSQEDCVARNDVIIVALHVEHFGNVFTKELSQLCAGKILVDVSNRKSGSSCCRHGNGDEKKTSNASALQDLVPEAAVVKAFNAVSVFFLEDFDVTTDTGKVVVVAADDDKARGTVCDLARGLGFEPRVGGGLAVARKMEEGVHRLFPHWQPVIPVTLGVTLTWFLFIVCRFYLLESKLLWDQLPLKIMNKVFAASALSLVSLAYLPGPVATVIQLVRDWKTRSGRAKYVGTLPGWLKKWLTSRRQLGLTAFWFLCLHAVMSSLLLSPTYMSSWYYPHEAVVVKLNLTEGTHKIHPLKPAAWMTWNAESSLLAGSLAFGVAALLAVTSLPSVSRSLSWAEWSLVHSRLGHVMLALAVAHLYFMSFKGWVVLGFPAILLRLSFASTMMPTTVLMCRPLVTVLSLVLPRLGPEGRRGCGRTATDEQPEQYRASPV